MDKLMEYDWPGNVRELENIIERGTILSGGKTFRVPELVTEHPDSIGDEGPVTLKQNERKHILWALQKTKWKVRGPRGTAELLDIPPSTLAFRMKKLGIPYGRGKSGLYQGVTHGSHNLSGVSHQFMDEIRIRYRLNQELFGAP